MDSIALLQTLLQRAQAERDNAMGVLRQAEALLAQAQAQARQLTDYRSAYDQRWTLHFQQSGARELLACRQSFGDRLGQAIDGQTSATQNQVRRVALARQALLAREQRVSAVRKLIERRNLELQRLNDRRDQRASDETAQRQHMRRSTLAP
jgi:flagellar FliJ protein